MAVRVQVTQLVFFVLNTLRLTQPMVGDFKVNPFNFYQSLRFP